MILFHKIAFLGDSVTEGCFELYPTSYGFDTVRRPADGYVAKSINKLSQTVDFVPDYRNFGRSGASTAYGLEHIGEVLAYQPELVTVCFGLNDIFHSEERFRSSLTEMLETLIKTVSSVILITPNRMNTYLHPALDKSAIKAATSTMEAQTSGKFDRMIMAAKEVSTNLGVTICDAYAVWGEMSKSIDVTDKLLINHINHPTPEMHDLFADLLTKTILGL